MEKKNGFTLAEVLITLAIIGIVSALVIPSVIRNYNDKKYNTARLKALKTFGEAGKLASINDEMNSQTNGLDFVNNVLSKYLKITKVCNNAHPTDCGFPSQIQPSNLSSAKKNSTGLKNWGAIGTSSPTSSADASAYISTADGFSALVHYNPNCARNSQQVKYLESCTVEECPAYAANEVCMNVIYDMNGIKGPNHVGEDIGFVTTFWSGLKAISVAPGIIPYDKAKAIYDEGGKSLMDAQKICADRGTKNIPYTLPSTYEMQSLTINAVINSLSDGGWSGSSLGGARWIVYYNGRRDYRLPPTAGVWCVRR